LILSVIGPFRRDVADVSNSYIEAPTSSSGAPYAEAKPGSHIPQVAVRSRDGGPGYRFPVLREARNWRRGIRSDDRAGWPDANTDAHVQVTARWGRTLGDKNRNREAFDGVSNQPSSPRRSRWPWNPCWESQHGF
jgi:hypothetical protein